MSNKQNVVLDLDQTLIYAEAAEDFDFDNKELEKRTCKLSMYNMDNYYIVFERPHLQEFLDILFKNYNVSVWTAASKDYAIFIIKNMIMTKKNRCLDYIFFSYHGDVSKTNYKRNPKNLKLLWEGFKLSDYTSDNTIIIDDFDQVTNCQPANSVKIKEFDVTKNNSEDDNELLGTVLPAIKNFFSN